MSHPKTVVKSEHAPRLQPQAKITLWFLAGWFVIGILIVTGLSAAAAEKPRHLKPGAVRTDTAIVQEVSQIRVSPQKELNFDQDIERLAQAERRFKEPLPYAEKKTRLLAPMQRIQNQKYVPTVRN